MPYDKCFENASSGLQVNFRNDRPPMYDDSTIMLDLETNEPGVQQVSVRVSQRNSNFEPVTTEHCEKIKLLIESCRREVSVGTQAGELPADV